MSRLLRLFAGDLAHSGFSHIRPASFSWVFDAPKPVAECNGDKGGWIRTPRNDNTWVIMEYRTALTAFTPNPSCSNIPTPNGGLPGGGRLLVEYVQPESDTPSYTIFAVQPDNSVVLSLRMVKDTVKRTIRLPAPSGSPLELKATPRNYRVGCN